MTNTTLRSSEGPASLRSTSLHLRRIDVHTHTGAMPLLTREASAEALERIEREAGTEKAIVSSARGVFYDMVLGNEETFAITRRSSMLYMYIYVDPLRLAESLVEIDRYAGQPHVAGIKTRPGYHQVAGDSDACLVLYRHAHQYDLPLLAHAYSLREVSELRRAADATGLKIILAHMGAGEWKESVDACRGCKSVWLDACTSVNEYDKIGYAIDELGISHLVYGTDATLLSPWWTIAMFESAGLSDAEKHAVYRDNALGIFGKRLG